MEVRAQQPRTTRRRPVVVPAPWFCHEIARGKSPRCAREARNQPCGVAPETPARRFTARQEEPDAPMEMVVENAEVGVGRDWQAAWLWRLQVPATVVR